MKTWSNIIFRLILAGVASSVILTGCGGDQKKELEEAKKSDDPSRKLIVLTWPDDYIAPTVVENFQEETGIEVEFRYFDSLGEMNGLLTSEPASFDLVVIDDVSLAEMIELQMFRKLDREKLNNFGNLDRRYTNQEFDKNNQYSIPYLWGTNLIAYRSDKIESPKPSWDLLFDESMKGKVVMFDSEADIYSVALKSLGYSANTEDGAQLKECSNKLIRQAKNLEARYEDLFVAMELLNSGEAWASLMYSCDAATLAAENPDIAYFLPEEGAPLWMDSLAVSREAKNVEEAHQFLNFLMRPKVAAEIANFLWGGCPNAVAVDFLESDLKEDEAINPREEILAKCEFYASPSPSRNLVMNQGMKEILDISREQLGVMASQSEDETVAPFQEE